MEAIKIKENKTTNRVNLMDTKTKEIGQFIGEIVSFNTSLKLHHWHITGEGSYAIHIALDEAVNALLDATDRLVETSYAMYGDLSIVVPQTKNNPNLIQSCVNFFNVVSTARELFAENFTQAILDDYQETIQQLLYKLKRLK